MVYNAFFKLLHYTVFTHPSAPESSKQLGRYVSGRLFMLRGSSRHTSLSKNFLPFNFSLLFLFGLMSFFPELSDWQVSNLGLDSAALCDCWRGEHWIAGWVGTPVSMACGVQYFKSPLGCGNWNPHTRRFTCTKTSYSVRSGKGIVHTVMKVYMQLCTAFGL